MRFKTYLRKDAKHSDIVTGVAWQATEEVISCSDDHDILQWNLLTNDSVKLLTLPIDYFPTELLIYSRSTTSGSAKKQISNDAFIVTTTDGKFHLISRNGRIERSVEAHRGALLSAEWNDDGTALVTSGEDGLIKIWSKTGMLRSTLASNSFPVYTVAWSPNSDQILYSLSRQLVIKPLQAHSKPLQWKAHDGLILKACWNTCNNLIVSGGEDCRYKIWDSYGRIMYCSPPNDYPITSLAWSLDGELFAAGSFNSLRLCDQAGWCHSLDKPQTQSIFSLVWSADGTQVAGACGNGHVIFAHVIERRMEWKNYEVTVRGRKTISVLNVVNEVVENLDFRDSIIKTAFDYGHLLVVTSNQCYIYNTKNWNTPHIFELKESNVSCVVQSERHFLMVTGAGLHVFTYEGRPVSSPRWAGMRTTFLNRDTVSLSNDTVAIRNKGDEKIVHIFESQNGKYVGDGKPFVHKMEVVEVALDQCGSANDRRLAIIDKNRDLYLVQVRALSTNIKRVQKLGVMLHSLKWNDSSNMLAALQDDKLVIFYYPAIVSVDKNLLPHTVIHRGDSDFGKNPKIVSFLGNQTCVRRVDGSLVSVPVSPYPAVLHGYVSSNRWDDANRLCRFIKDAALWACLAAMSLAGKELNTAEIAYAAIDEVDKVDYLQYVKNLPMKELQSSEMTLLCGNAKEAESILLNSSLVFRAIMLNLRLYKWERALDLALKHGNHIDTVLAFRRKYLDQFEKEEENLRFVEIAKETNVDWIAVNAKIDEEYDKEKSSGYSTPMSRRSSISRR